MVSKSNKFNQYSNWKSMISRVFFGFKIIPYKFMLILILLSLWLGEWYPISNFPMFSTFQNSNNFVYITDGRDRPISLELEFGFHPAFLKKLYRSRLKKLSNQENQQVNFNRNFENYLKIFFTTNNIKVSQNTIDKTIKELSKEIHQQEIAAKAGEKLLQYIVTEQNKEMTKHTDYHQLKLWNVIVALKHDQIVQEKKLIAELQLP